jgi:ribosomal protein S20
MISNVDKKHFIFIDESGTSDIKSYQTQPFFTVIGLVISENNREKLRIDFEDLKLKHFGSKNYVIHNTEIRRYLRTDKKIKDFSLDLDKFLNKHNFFILSTIVNKEKAFKLGWAKITVLNRSYRSLFSNLLKFLIAKNLKGQVVSEASNSEQDIIIYQNVFHYLVNGISNLDISPQEAKKHLTSISFVTKLNNDPEEQLSDLYGICPKIEEELKNKTNKVEQLNPIQKILLNSFRKKLFVGKATKKDKARLYKAINPLVELP